MKLTHLQGIFPALMTAYTPDHSAIDHEKVRSLVRFLIHKGVHGLYVCGSSAEMLLLSLQERMELLETVLEETKAADRHVAVIAHVGCNSTKDMYVLAEHAEKVGADAISSITPLYFAYGFTEVYQLYKDLAASISLPVILYNIPARSGITLNADQLRALFDIPNVAGMKFSSSDFYLLERMVTEYPDKVFYNGSDEMLLSGLAAGANGGIGTTYNFQPERMLEIYRLYHENKMQEALSVQRKANDAIEIVLKYNVLAACKEVLRIGGLDYGTCREPFVPFSSEQLAELEAAVHEKLGREFMKI